MTSDVDCAFEILLGSIKDIPRQLQLMIGAIVAAQEDFPTPADGWEQFITDIEHTNEKHGYNLTV